MTSHLDDGTIQDLLDGELHSSALPPIQAHLAVCAECRARLEAGRVFMAEADALIEMLDEPPVAVPARTIPTPQVKRDWTLRLAWAASLVIAVGAGYYSRGGVLRPTVNRPDAIASGKLAQRLDTTPPAVIAPAIAPARPAERASVPTPAGRRETVARADELVKPNVAEPPARDAGNAVEAMRTAPATSALGAAAAAAPPQARADPQDARERRTILQPRDQVTAKQLADVSSADSVSFPEAVRLLGGTLRLIEGMVPSRLEAVGATVRVIYSVRQGELVLSQSVTNGVREIRLTAPAGFPADSLAKLRRKVQE